MAGTLQVCFVVHVPIMVSVSSIHGACSIAPGCSQSLFYFGLMSTPAPAKIQLPMRKKIKSSSSASESDSVGSEANIDSSRR